MLTDVVSKAVSEKQRKDRSCNFEFITLYLMEYMQQQKKISCNSESLNYSLDYVLQRKARSCRIEFNGLYFMDYIYIKEWREISCNFESLHCIYWTIFNSKRRAAVILSQYTTFWTTFNSVGTETVNLSSVHRTFWTIFPFGWGNIISIARFTK
jgi:hypothetical protein